MEESSCMTSLQGPNEVAQPHDVALLKVNEDVRNIIVIILIIMVHCVEKPKGEWSL